MDVLSSRILVRPSDLGRSRRFYRDVLAVYGEFGPPDDPGVVFFPGQGFLEVSGHAPGLAGVSVMIWIQVRGVHDERHHVAVARADIAVAYDYALRAPPDPLIELPAHGRPPRADSAVRPHRLRGALGPRP